MGRTPTRLRSTLLNHHHRRRYDKRKRVYRHSDQQKRTTLSVQVNQCMHTHAHTKKMIMERKLDTFFEDRQR